MPRCCDVPIDHIPYVWPKIEPFLAKSLKFDDCARYQAVDVFELLLQGGSRRLWIAFDTERQEFDGAAVTEIIQSPRCRECRAWLVGGKNLRLWQDEMRAMIEAYAQAEGCQFVTGSGRRGWTRMPGYESAGILFQKAL